MQEKLKDIQLLLLDVDGVMTDGHIVYDGNGVETKYFNVRDGHGIKLLQRHGIQVGIITGRTSVVVDYVASCGGGRGAVREVCDMILKARGFWEKIVANYEL